MERKNKPESIVIVGVGNLLMRDEGIGIHAVQALQEMDMPEGVRLVDGGTSPDIVAYTRPGDKLIIIDAAKAGGEPGAIYRFFPEDLADDRTELSSAHEMGIPRNLKLMTLSGTGPRQTVIIGVEPQDISPGLELSAVLRQKMPEIMRIIFLEIGRTS